jgi:thiol-disulfide isomerase/thioredoxin
MIGTLMRRSLFLMITAVFSVAGSGMRQPLQAQDQIGIAVGSTPEAAVVEDLDGNAVDLGDYVGKGKPVLVEFWATWCSNCKALEPQLLASKQKYGEDVEFVIVAVAVNQSRRRVSRHVAEHEMPGRILYDNKGAAVRAFMAPATAYVVVLNSEGVVAYTGLGAEQDIAAAIRKGLGD